MAHLYHMIKADYLQRTRSYSFLITLALTIFMAYSFVPPDTANYTTLSASGYRGVYNSAWVGYVSGIMTTVMLSFAGFLLVNSGIKKDIDTEVGLIIATTPISNFKYLFYKQLSNYLVLLTIVCITFTVSIIVFLFRGNGQPLVINHFILPYLFFAIPALFVVSALAVVAEVFLRRRTVLQFIAYFFLVGICMSFINSKTQTDTSGVFDPFGLSLLTKAVAHHINTHFNENIKEVSFGFIFNGHKAYKPFVWPGLKWSGIFIISRLIWMLLGLGFVCLSSLFFHRFDFKQAINYKSKKQQLHKEVSETLQSASLQKVILPPLEFDFGIIPFIKTELLLLVRQGNKWLWLINAGLWITMCFVPLSIAYAYLLPILLFLQVQRWSELVTKEKTNRVHYFAYAAYKPLQRMLPAQILAGIIVGIILALPVMVRCGLAANGLAIVSIVNGIILIVLISVTMGVLTGGKKLFEVLFFFLTYCVINKLPVADYLGALPHANNGLLIAGIFGVNILLVVFSIMVRNYQSTRN